MLEHIAIGGPAILTDRMLVAMHSDNIGRYVGQASSELWQAAGYRSGLDDRCVSGGKRKKSINYRFQIAHASHNHFGHEAVLPGYSVGFHNLRRVIQHLRDTPHLAGHGPDSDMSCDFQIVRLRVGRNGVARNCAAILEFRIRSAVLGLERPTRAARSRIVIRPFCASAVIMARSVLSMERLT
jgi:hypothetical protein